jgi:hypothetical protein
LIVAHVYFIKYISYDGETANLGSHVVEFMLRNTLLFLSVFFGALEVFQMFDFGFKFWLDPFNYINIGSILLNVFICLNYGYGIMLVG